MNQRPTANGLPASEPSDVPGDNLFDDNETDFLPAPELEQIGKSLIATCPEELGHLATAEIRYLWKRRGGKKSGKDVLGFCWTASGLGKFFSGAHFVVWVAADTARTHQLTNWQIEAAVFHELLHADIDAETAKPSPRPHDVEMFVAEVERYGLWKSELHEARIAFDQVPLPLFGQASRAA